MLKVLSLPYPQRDCLTSCKPKLVLQKTAPDGNQTQSAHPARFSPEDKNSQYRVIVKRRFGILPTQQAKIVYCELIQAYVGCIILIQKSYCSLPTSITKFYYGLLLGVAPNCSSEDSVVYSKISFVLSTGEIVRTNYLQVCVYVNLHISVVSSSFTRIFRSFLCWLEGSGHGVK